MADAPLSPPAPHAALAAIEARAARLRRVAQRQCVALLADDMPTMRLLLAQTLRDAGFADIVQATDGAAALRAMDARGCDLILADWNMPIMDGLTLLERIRAHPAHQDVIFIMITAENADQRVLRAMGEGPDDYLTKPVSPEKLTRRLELILARRGAAARADRLVAMGLPRRALDEYLMAARNRPRARWPHFGLAELLTRQGRLAEAKQCYARLLRHDPQAAAAMVGLGRVAEQSGDLDEAMAMYRQARQANPDYAGAVDALADLCRRLGRPEEEAQALEEAWQATGVLASQRLERLGWLRHGLGQPEAAQEALEQAIGHTPRLAHGPAGLLLARCLLAQGRWRRAEAALRRVAGDADDIATKAEAMLLLAETLLSRGQGAAAAKVYEDMAQPAAWPDNQRPFALNRLHAEAAAAHLRQGQPEEAARLMALSLAMDPDDHANAARLEEIAAQADAAGLWSGARQMAAAEPDLATVERYSRLGVELAAQGRHAEALEQYRHGLAVDPTAGRLHFNVAKLHLRAANPDEAAASLELARRHGQAASDWELLERLAELHVSLGQAATARKILLDVLEAEPQRLAAAEMLESL